MLSNNSCREGSRRKGGGGGGSKTLINKLSLATFISNATFLFFTNLVFIYFRRKERRRPKWLNERNISNQTTELALIPCSQQTKIHLKLHLKTQNSSITAS